MNNRNIFPSTLADALKASAGEKYRPSNGVEGDIFQGRWCSDCTKDVNQHCKIVMMSLVLDVDDPEYPDEWQYGEDGQPRCTAFEELTDGKEGRERARGTM